MATVIRMPEVLAGSSEAAIQTWLVSVGQTVAVGVPLAEVETEKAIVEYAAETAGTVLQLLVTEGVSVNVGEPIAVVGEPGEAVDGIAPAAPVENAEPVPAPDVIAVGASTPAAEVPDVAGVPITEPAIQLTPSTQDAGDRRFISPLVRRLARERGLDLSAVAGSGPSGRIVRRDIDGLSAPAAAQAPATTTASAASADFVDIPHTGMRRAIARRLTESKSTVPHFYLIADCRVDALIALRKSVNEASPVKVSLNDFVLKAAAGAFLDVPEANATWTDTAIRRYSTVDMAVAVAIEGGLVTPVVRGVEKLKITDVSRTVSELAERARAGRLKQNELEGGSFSVSNLGMYGIPEFSAIINPPQSSILAVGAARQQPVVDDGVLAVGTVMTVTLSADHRVIDGALGAQWMAAFVKRIENPVSILI